MSAFTAEDHRFMARALELAANGLQSTHPNPRVGCVLANNGQIVGEGWHRVSGGPHAEIKALGDCNGQARGSTAYVTLEPCDHQGQTGACSLALIEAGVSRVVAAIEDPYPEVAGRGLQRLRNAGIEVEIGLLAEQAERLNAGFLKRMRCGKPWVRVKLAASIDGRTALASGESQWITSKQARRDVQSWRARASAVMTGFATVAADNPRLNVRFPEANRQPIRIILDSDFRTPPDAALFNLPGAVWLTGTGPIDQTLENGHPARLVSLPASAGGVDLVALMNWLGEEQINELHVEAGATLSGALLQAGLVDELLLYLAPSLLGDGSRGLFALPGLDTMADRVNLEWVDCRRVGTDLRLQLRPIPS
jgi:diaminohydroxyphosphoribosylaminopyrimidine deaminase/5-amino-6-(5-phosphoribosylamino)uracil reductase